jgi:hypothetical protein
MTNKQDFLLDNLKFQNNWIAHANNTSSILTALVTAYLIWIFDSKLITNLETEFERVIAVLLFFTVLLALYHLANVIYPRVSLSSKSIIYFGGIKNYTKEEYPEKLMNLNENDIYEEILEQTYVNALIADKKFMHLRCAMISCSVVLIATIPLIL